MTAPDRFGVPATCAPYSPAPWRVRPGAPQLHGAMKVSVIAGADPKLRAQRSNLLRYGGIGLLAVGGGLVATATCRRRAPPPGWTPPASGVGGAVATRTLR